MKKIILAFDSFKGSINSMEIAKAAEQAIIKEYPNCEIVCFPIADGGEGTTAAICAKWDVNYISCQVHDPRMKAIDASYAITADGKTAVLEMSSSSGLPLVPKVLQNPLQTTTVGTGELILDAINRGCRNFILGIGGSATNDAGIGLLEALGVKFLDKNRKVLKPIGSSLEYIEFIDESELHPELKNCKFTIACDVNNPLFGPQGAACIFAPQKGATVSEVEILDHGLRHYTEVIKRHKGMDIASIPGAGAAGGMGGGLLPFLNATLKSGIETILDILEFKESLKNADLIFTGEGKLDAQTRMGKALGGILKRALEAKVPIIGLGGSVEGIKELNEMGFTAVYSIQPGIVSLEQAMQKEYALDNIQNTVTQILRIIKQISLYSNHKK